MVPGRESQFQYIGKNEVLSSVGKTHGRRLMSALMTAEVRVDLAVSESASPPSSLRRLDETVSVLA